jgi:hypothetical protein
MNKYALTAAVALLSLGSAAQANIVLNGDFEADTPGTVPPSNFTVFPDAEIMVLDGQAYVSNAGGTGSGASLTNRFASFGAGDVSNTSVLSQVLNTTAGQAYSIGFDFGAFGNGSQSLNVGLFDSDTNAQLTSFTVTDIGSADLDTLFQAYTGSFTAIGALTRLSFSISGQPSGNVDALLDNVAVNAVPEPGTWAMMLVGFGAVGYSLRRRKDYRMAQAV